MVKKIPWGACMLACCVCCVLSGKVSATSWSLVQRSSNDCGASLCVIEKPRERWGHSSRWTAEPEKIIIYATHARGELRASHVADCLLSPVAWRHACCNVVMQYPTSRRDHPVNINVSAVYLVYFTMNMGILIITSCLYFVCCYSW
jgi:hypothetical protein